MPTDTAGHGAMGTADTAPAGGPAHTGAGPQTGPETASEALKSAVNDDDTKKNKVNEVDKAEDDIPHMIPIIPSRNWVSQATYYWAEPLVRYGYSHILTAENIGPVDQSLEATYLELQLSAAWDAECKRAKRVSEGKDVETRPSLMRALLLAWKWEIFVPGVFKLFYDLANIFSPLVSKNLLIYMEGSEAHKELTGSPYTINRGIALAFTLLIMQAIAALLNNYYNYKMTLIGMNMKTALTTMLYKKMLKFSPKSQSSFHAGKVTNIISSDCARIERFMQFFHVVWSAPMDIVIVFILLIIQLKVSALVGIGFIICLIPFQSLITKALGRLRRKIVPITDKRIKLITEILQGVKILKYFAWESTFMDRIQFLRKKEAKLITTRLTILALLLAVSQSIPTLSASLSIMTYSFLQNMNAAKIFPALSWFQELRLPMLFLPRLVVLQAEARVGVTRLQELLEAEELTPQAVSGSKWDILNATSNAEEDNIKQMVRIKSGYFTWVVSDDEDEEQQEDTSSTERHVYKTESAVSTDTLRDEGDKLKVKGDGDDNKVDITTTSPLPDKQVYHSHISKTKLLKATLKDIDLQLPEGSLTCIVGSIGSGKSSLLSAIMGEMYQIDGYRQCDSVIGYCPQQAWIQNSTIKDNITFGRDFDRERYLKTIRDCCLLHDIKMFPEGDITEVGERGITLSGGQKQRINLARSLYFDSPLILMDDPLSAVDAHVGKYIFDYCIMKALANKTRVLVTHHLHHTLRSDWIVCMDHGRIVEQGKVSELLSRKGFYYKLMLQYGGVTGSKSEADGDSRRSRSRASTSVPMRPQESKETGATPVPTIEEEEEESQANEEVPTIDKEEEEEEELDIQRIIEESERHALDVEEDKKLFEQDINLHINSENEKEELNQIEAIIQEASKTSKELMEKEERAEGAVKWGVWGAYINEGGGLPVALYVTAMLVGYVALQIGQNFWLMEWTNNKIPKFSSQDYVGIYFSFAICQLICCFFYALSLSTLGVKAAVNLHNKAVDRIMHAPMRFFDTNSTGRVTNRLSKDQDEIDSNIIDSFRMFLSTAGISIGSLILIIYATWMFIIPLIPSLVIYYFLQLIYRKTSRELKRVNALARSPLYSHISETISGLGTIRAFGEQKRFISKVIVLIDLSNSTNFMNNVLQRWLGVRTEIIGAILVFFTALFGVLERDKGFMSPALLGLSLAYSLLITGTINWAIRQYAETEISMNSVERIHHYAYNIPQENYQGTELPPENWPTKGEIEIKNLVIKYDPSLPEVIKDVSVKVRDGEMIGIVGRTGSGKSTLNQTLFRILEPTSGSIIIDGVDISKLDLMTLRKALAVIPQDPFLITGTVRDNVDPCEEFTDIEIWDSLEKASLRDTYISNVKDENNRSATNNGLDTKIEFSGDNLSVGQKQLTCLARALLKKPKILVMDEATANVDSATDEWIQTSLRRDFAGVTILTIAHRLNTIMDYDRILVLDSGKVIEYASPAELLGIVPVPEGSQSLVCGEFESMVNETGAENAVYLKSLVKLPPTSTQTN